MRIKRIELLSDYKCFKKGTVFDFLDTPIICIIGKNSTGKTIFLKMLNDIISYINSIKNISEENNLEEFEKVRKEFIGSKPNYVDDEEINEMIKEIIKKNLSESDMDNDIKYNYNYIIPEELEDKEEFYFKIEFNYNYKNYEVKKNKYENIEEHEIPEIKIDKSGFYNTEIKIAEDVSDIFVEALSYVNINYDSFDNYFFKNNKEINYNDLSSGEKSIIEVFSLFSQKNREQFEEYLFLFDEPDKYLNNEIKRKYISLLQKAINENDQIIFTTHSTELISDLDEIQVYKCENYEIKNINFNPFGEDSSTLTSKLFGDKYGISKVAREMYTDFLYKINNTNNLLKLENLKKEIKDKFSDNFYTDELIKKINNKIKEG